MRKSLFLVFLSLFAFSVNAQKFGYIDSEYIMSKMPQYKDLKTNMDKYLDKWTTDIRKEYDGVNDLKMKFQQEEILLTDEMKRERLTAIQGKEDELKVLNNKVFGMEGILFQ
ncbi:MAG: OmpH family outer membrane protein, partial [Spirosomaceae bacterium]|nr:OmpH family outer membrane protein [Spirosomataceae bacterium]